MEIEESCEGLAASTKTKFLSLSSIEKTWKAVVPVYPFEFSFVDDEFGQSLFSLIRTGYLIMVFCALAVIISCPGLFRLSSNAAEQLIKEIGLRYEWLPPHSGIL